MAIPLFLLFLLLTLATSVLLVGSFLLPARRSVAGIGLLVFWLCNLIVPVHWMALLDLLGLRSPIRVSHLFIWGGLAFAGALAAWLYRRRFRPSGGWFEADEESRRPIPWHVAVGLLLVLGTYAMLSLRMAFSFPDSWDWDAVSYHYPVALRWVQEGTLRITSATNWHASFPGNAEILDFLVLSTGRERLLEFVQWPGALILLLACLRLGRRLGASAAPAWPVVTTVLMIPMVANQSMSGYVDLFGTALLLGSLTLVLEYCDRRKTGVEGTARPGLLVAAGLGCGLAVGTKPVFWIYAVVLSLATTALLARQGARPDPRAWRRMVWYMAATAVPCVFWFARAMFCTGNPMYPFAWHIGHWWFPGVHPSEITDLDYYLCYVRHWAEWFVCPWIEWKKSPGYLLTNYTMDNGFGGGFATFTMPGVLFAVWLARRRRPDLRLWLGALGGLAVLWWFFLQRAGRYGLPVFVLAVLLSAPFFEVLEARATRLYRLIYLLAFSVTAAVLVFEPLYTMLQTVRYHTWSRAAFVGYPEVIDTLRPGSRVLNLGHYTLNHALAGSGLTNRVVPSWETPDTLTAEFLRSHQVDYVVEKSVTTAGAPVADPRPPVEGLEIYHSSRIKEGNQVADWRIWSANRLRTDSPQPVRQPPVP